MPLQTSKFIISQADAESIGLGLNLIFNNALLFSSAHPSTGKAADDLSIKIRNFIPKNKMVSVLKNGESIYIEKWVVDHRLNIARTLQQFLKLNIESISFDSEIMGIDIRTFIQEYTVALASGGTADMISKNLKDKSITSVHINYITLKKVTKDQKIVNDDFNISDINRHDDPVATSKNPLLSKLDSDEINSHVYDRLGKIFSINDIIGGSSNLTDVMVGEGKLGEDTGEFGTGEFGTGIFEEGTGGFGGGNRSGVWGIPRIKEQFRALGIEVSQGKAKSGEAINYDNLFESLISMTDSLKQNEALQEKLVRLTSDSSISTELDQLTLKTVVQIVRKEFKSGNTDIKKLSFLIKRIAPSRDELRKLLPALKNELLDEGMLVTEFLQLSMLLDDELSSEYALDSLFKEAEDFGVSRSELTKVLAQNPGESARLLIQAAEIEKRTKGAKLNVSDYLGDMIEEMTTAIAEERIVGKDSGDIHTILSDVIATVEKTVVSKIRQNEKDDKVATSIENELSKRFPKTLDKLKTDWIVNTLGNAKEVSQEGVLAVINSVAANQEEVDKYRDSVNLFRQKFGFSENEITNILSNAKSRKKVEKEKRNILLLPPRNTVHMIKRYIEEYIRHKHPFSILISSCDQDTVDGFTYPEEVGYYVSKKLRLLDIAGYIRVRGKEFAVVILPMTDTMGLKIIKPRFMKGNCCGNSNTTTIAVDDENPVEGYEQLMKSILRRHLKKSLPAK